MTVQLWLSFVIASSIMLVIPGPTILNVIAYATSHGPRATLPLVAGRRSRRHYPDNTISRRARQLAGNLINRIYCDRNRRWSIPLIFRLDDDKISRLLPLRVDRVTNTENLEAIF
ncbi:MAG: hypothetical protein ACI854_001076 [Arenicella sp.]|jgi:hypothetical protein